MTDVIDMTGKATFDTQKLVDELEEAGMLREQARGVTRALRNALNKHYQLVLETIQTKSQLR